MGGISNWVWASSAVRDIDEMDEGGSWECCFGDGLAMEEELWWSGRWSGVRFFVPQP